MTIFILGTPEETAKALDDNSLGKMISACAQTLSNIHYLVDKLNNKPWLFIESVAPLLMPKHDHDLWSLWGKKCLANYNVLLEYAKASCKEWEYRFSDPRELRKAPATRNVAEHKHHDVIEWCEQNKPDLPMFKPDSEELTLTYTPEELVKQTTPFPLVMPEKYKIYFIRYAAGAIENFALTDLKEPWETIPADAQANVCESYRNLYRAKLAKTGRKLKCKECDGKGHVECGSSAGTWVSPCDCEEGYIKQSPKFTRREKPEWLGDL